MSGEKIVRALDGIPDVQLESAMNVYERKRGLRHIWLRVILCLLALAVVLAFLLWPDSREEQGPIPESGIVQVDEITT